MKHTPGPWTASKKYWDPAREKDIYQVSMKDWDTQICTLVDGPSSDANARLIAAAPEMVEVLNAIMLDEETPEHVSERILIVLEELGL